MVWNMVLESRTSSMEMSMWVSMWIVLPMAMGSTIGKMEVFIRVILSKESDMAMVSGRTKTSNIKVTIN